ncbi:unnamed protein product [Hydatigera taeniaeformis]|uniref:Uncharacterized protein n=1 Tax=Hydatigena taeniaeformis TaxID=6205 RepID=A0A0R3XCA1_HYDTA|nr:unnamed protein product [Hydatigera taeniaeformis]
MDRILEDLFASASAAAKTAPGPNLEEALGEFRTTAQRMRDERMKIFSECGAKLDQCKVPCRRNRLLETFIDTWQRRLAEGNNISGTLIFNFN